jgi:Fe-S-cluster containining protein
MKNTVLAKAKRTFTSVLPVSKDRQGACIGCGQCCKLPAKCLFLEYRADGSSYCRAYGFRPLNCRKYPRTKLEFLTADTCGFRFEDQPETSIGQGQ